MKAKIRSSSSPSSAVDEVELILSVGGSGIGNDIFKMTSGGSRLNSISRSPYPTSSTTCLDFTDTEFGYEMNIPSGHPYHHHYHHHRPPSQALFHCMAQGSDSLWEHSGTPAHHHHHHHPVFHYPSEEPCNNNSHHHHHHHAGLGGEFFPSPLSSNRQLTPKAHKTRRRVANVAQRRAANIRERRRMYNLNEAFDDLRKKVPTFAYEKRLSRIETLRLAITYISFMTEVVHGNGSNDDGTAHHWSDHISNLNYNIENNASLAAATNLRISRTAEDDSYGIETHLRHAK